MELAVSSFSDILNKTDLSSGVVFFMMTIVASQLIHYTSLLRQFYLFMM